MTRANASACPRATGLGWAAWVAVALFTSCAASKRTADDVGLEVRRTVPRVHLPPPPVQDAATEPAPPERPSVRALSWGVFGEGERIAELQGVAVGSSTLLAWVTYVDPGAPAPVDPSNGAGRGGRAGRADRRARVEPRTATLFVRAVDVQGEPMGVPKVISSRAMPLGGVSVISSVARDVVTLGWTGQEGGRSQVFLTQVDKAGEKMAQRMLTRGDSDCSDVSVTAAGDGFLVAWVEQRGEIAEVHAARVGKDLVRVGATRKVAQAGGDASQVRLVAHGDDAMLLWSEVRTGAQKSGIFGVRLETATLTPRSDVTRVVPAVHAHSLRLAQAGDGWVVAWIEEASGGAQARQVAIAPIAAARASARTGEPRRFELPAAITSLALQCSATCRVVAAGTRGDALEVYAFRDDAARDPQASTPRLIGSVVGTSGEDMSPVLLGDWLFFAEDDLHGKGRIAKSRLLWP